jgi:hypothetical protein
MSTRSVIARKTKSGFKGVYHHWDGYPSGLGATLFEVRNKVFGGDTARMLRYLIDQHPAGWSTINTDWQFPEGSRPDHNTQICKVCGRMNWEHYRQYYKASFTDIPSEWERAGRPEPPEGSEIQVLGHQAQHDEQPTGPEPFNDGAWEVTEKNASGSGCEYAYVFDGNGTMEIQSSYHSGGDKMIGAFGVGDEKATWRTIAVVNLDGDEPDWDNLNKAA